MNNISMNQALSIWSELWQAYYSKNGFGGDTAEIYAYRLMPYHPVLDFPNAQCFNSSHIEYFNEAKHSLVELLYLFQKDANCDIEVDNQLLGDWTNNGEIFNHRCHVRIMDRISIPKAVNR
jgi:hypothetical protein